MIATVPPTAAASNLARTEEIPPGARGFFTGPGLPLFLFSALLVYEAFLAAVVFGPENFGAWGAFAQEFKQWCFNYDPRTGGMEWAAVWVMMLEPVFVVGVALFLWRSALQSLRRPGAWRRHFGAAVSGGGAALLAMAVLYAYGRGSAEEQESLPFPGERIRVGLIPPPFTYADQKGHPFQLEELRGKAVLVTGIYASCAVSCPLILRDIRDLLATLPPEDRAWLSVAALSLNPEYEDSALMDAVAEGNGFAYPEFRYLNGEPAAMSDVLTRLQFGRVRDPETGIIGHANLFLLLDADGKIAYRLTQDEQRRPWLRAAVLELTAEARARNAAASE